MATRRKVTKVEEKVEEKKETRKMISATDFVPVWQKADTADEVNEAFGKDAGNLWASSFASRLRAAGVPLKKMPRKGGGKKGLDVEALTALAEKNAPKTK